MPKRLITDQSIRWPEGKGPGWTRCPEGYDGGQYGRVDHVVICKPDGTAVFDRLVTTEGPHVIVIAYGFDLTDATWKIGLVKEARDTAAPIDWTASLSFWGPPRGFRDERESSSEAAIRETGQEAGATVVLEVLELGNFITNETTTASWSPFVALNVDLSALQAIAPERGEKIYKSQFFSLEQVENMIKMGVWDNASTASMVLMSTVLLFRLHILPKLPVRLSA